MYVFFRKPTKRAVKSLALKNPGWVTIIMPLTPPTPGGWGWGECAYSQVPLFHSGGFASGPWGEVCHSPHGNCKCNYGGGGTIHPPTGIFDSFKLKIKIAQYLANVLVDNVVLAGDFNMPPCPELDRLTPGGAVDSPLGLHFWPYWRLALEKNQSATYAAMSRIDLVYVSGPVLAKVQEIYFCLGEYPITCLSCYTWISVLLPLTACGACHDSGSQMTGLPQVLNQMYKRYWDTNPTATDPASSWDAFKAHVQGYYQMKIGQIWHSSGLELARAE